MNQRIAVITVAGVCCFGHAGAQEPTFSTKRESVRVDILVTDKGRAVTGLTLPDFEVLDNGVRQELELISSDKMPINAILALDTSVSVAGERLEHLRAAGRALLGALKPGDRAALVTFSHVVVLNEPITADLSRVRSALDRPYTRGATALVDGTYAAMTVADTDPGRSLLIVFSDGVDTASWLSPEQVLKSARRTDAVVYAISVRGPEKPEFLRELSRLTGGGLVEIESMKDLGNTFVNILAEFRDRYLVSYSPGSDPTPGWHRLEVRLKARRLAKPTIKARAGYMAAPLP